MNSCSGLYAVNAGYRKSDIGVNWYYVLADDAKEARRLFCAKSMWLDVYGIEECSCEKRDEVLTHPDRYAVIRRE